MARVPGRGLSNMWKVTRNGKTELAAIRTSQDRDFAFQAGNHGAKWKTLDDVEWVVLSVVDDRAAPKNIQVYMFPATDVQQRFRAAYKARIEAGHVHKNNFGMWLGLESGQQGLPTSVGTGIIEKYQPIAVYPIAELLSSDQGEVEGAASDGSELQEFRQMTTIAEVLRCARERVAEIAGVRVDAVRLEFKT